MLLCEVYHATSGVKEQVQPEQVQDVLAQPDTLLWIDIEHPEESDLAWLSNTFHFHPLALEDVRNQQQRAKIDRYDRYYFFVLRAIDYHPKARRVDSSQVDIFIGGNYLVTIHRAHLPALDHVRQRWTQARLQNESAAFLFYLMTDILVDEYFPVIDVIGDKIDTLDTQIFTANDPAALESIFKLRRNLLSIRKILAPLRDAFNELIRSEEGGTIFPIEQTRVFFSDVYDHILRLTDFVDTYRDMLSSSLDAYQSAQSNRLNENMQRLTVAATILATSTLVTGFYGMNLRGVGINSSWPYGGLLVLVLLVLVTFVEIYIFRRRGWF